MSNPNNATSPTIAGVLSGGGAKGYFQAQLWHLIASTFSLKADVMSGVSVGALNAAMIAQDKTTQMIRVWSEVREKDVYTRRSLFSIASRFAIHRIGIGRPPTGGYDNNPLLQLIKANTRYEDVRIPLKIGRVNLATGAYHATISANHFHKQILASTAIPVVWSPVDIHEEFDEHDAPDQWVDGGVRNVTPIGDVLPHFPDLLIIIPTAPYPPTPARTARRKDLLDIGLRSLEIMMEEVFANDIDRYLDTNNLANQLREADITPKSRRGKPLHCFRHLVLAPTKPLGDPLDFSPDSLAMRRDHATEIFRARRDEIEAKINQTRTTPT